MATRALLGDDHRIVREDLRSLLEAQGKFEVVGEVENGRDAVRRAGNLRPDVVVMDIGMRDLNGVEATSRGALQPRGDRRGHGARRSARTGAAPPS